MSKAGDISINLVINDEDFKVSVRNAGNLLNVLRGDLTRVADATNRTQNHITDFATKLRHSMTTVAAARFAVLDFHDVFLRLPIAMIKASGEIEKTTALMTGLSQEINKARREQEGLNSTKMVFEMAKNAPFEVKALTDSFIKLKSGGIDPTDGSLKILSDSIAKFGGTSETIHRASIALQQMSGKGVISMEELRQQLGEAIPTAMKAMAVGTNMSMAELTKAVSKGTVEAGGAIDRMLAILRVEDQGASLKMMDTWVGQIERLKTSWMLFSNDVGQSGGFFKAVTDQIKNLNSMFSDPSMVVYAHEISTTLASMVNGLVSFTQTVINNWETIKSVGEALIVLWASSKLAGALVTIGSLYTSTFAAIRAAISGAKLAEEARLATIPANIAAEIAAKRAGLVQEMAIIRQRLANTSAMSASEIAENRARLAALMAQVRTHNATLAAMNPRAQEIRDNMAQTQRVLAAKQAEYTQLQARATLYRNMERVANATNNAALAAQYQGVAIAAERGMARVAAAQAALVQTSAVQHAALRAQLAGTGGAFSAFGAKVAGVVSGLRVGMSALGAALGGPFGIITTLLFVGGMAWLEWGRKAREASEEAVSAVERVRDKLAQVGDLQKLQIALDAKNLEIMQAKSAAEMVMGSSGASKQDKAKWANELKKLMTEKAEIERAIRDAPAQLMKGRIGKVSSGVVKGVTDEVESITVNMRLKYDKMHQDLQDRFDKGQIQKKDFAAKDAKLLRDQALESTKLELDVYKKRMKDVDAAIAKAKKEKKPENGELMQGFLDQKAQLIPGLREAETNYKRAQSTDKPLELIGKGTEKVSAYAAKLVDLRGEFERLNAEILGGDTEKTKKLMEEFATNGSFAAFNTDGNKNAMKKASESVDAATDVNKMFQSIRSKIESGKSKVDEMTQELGGEDKNTAKLSSQITSLAAGLEKVKDKLDPAVYELYKKALAGLTDEAKKTEDQLSSVGASVDIDKLGKKINNALIGMKAENSGEKSAIAVLQEELESLSKRLQGNDSALAALEALKKSLKEFSDLSGAKTKIIGDEFITGLKAKTASINADITGDRRVVAKASADSDIAAEHKSVTTATEKMGKDTEQAKKAWEEYANYVSARNIKLGKELQTPLQNLADEWGKVGKQMEEVTTKWADGFLEEMLKATTGAKTDFKSLIASMLTDILRINLKKQLSSGIDKVFGSIGDFFTKAMGGDAKSGEKQSSLLTSATSTLTKVFDGLGIKVNGDVVASMTKMVFGKTTETTATMTATTAMITLAASANVAASALMAMAASSGMSGGSLGVGIFGGSFGADGMGSLANGSIAADFSQYANGGIMTEFGNVPLRKYAGGGIANMPQMAMFGEGSMPEAYVPLPDGRSIPVTMNGSSGGQNVNISIVVNKDGSGKESSVGDGAQAWKGVADRVKTIVVEEMIMQKRPGGLLYK